MVAESGMKDPSVLRRSSDGAGQHVRHLLLQARVGRQADGIGVAFGFQEPLDLALAEGDIGREAVQRPQALIERLESLEPATAKIR